MGPVIQFIIFLVLAAGLGYGMYKFAHYLARPKAKAPAPVEVPPSGSGTHPATAPESGGAASAAVGHEAAK